MKFNFYDWDSTKYKEFINYLFSLEDIKYRDFTKKIVMSSKYELIGIRLPIMRSIAKEISKTNLISFLDIVESNYFEEVFISGIVTTFIKDNKLFNKYFNIYIKKIDNWSLCDSFCASIKYSDEMINTAIKLSLDKKEFISRVGLIMLLDNFVRKEYLSLIFDTLNKIDSDKYYVNMAEAWLLCDMFIKFRDETLEFLKDNSLNNFTVNKAISKIRDSYRVSKEDKIVVSTYRRK